MFSVSTKIKLHYTDAAGVLFFGNYFKLIHDAYEEFLDSIGLNLGYIIDSSDYLLLIAHSEADYLLPQRAGDNVTVEITVEKIGHTSFILKYIIKNKLGQTAAELKTVHVAVDKTSGKKIKLPEIIKSGLKKHT